jgi:hypothetical protein
MAPARRPRVGTLFAKVLQGPAHRNASAAQVFNPLARQAQRAVQTPPCCPWLTDMTIRLQRAVGMPPALADRAGAGSGIAPAQWAQGPAPAAAAPFARPILLLETLLAMRLELLSRERAWPPQTQAQRQAVLMRLWEQRPPGLFEQGGTAESIARCLQTAFAEAAAGRKLEAALQFKRAYYLVCCTASAGARARLRPDSHNGGPV